MIDLNVLAPKKLESSDIDVTVLGIVYDVVLVLPDG